MFLSNPLFLVVAAAPLAVCVLLVRAGQERAAWTLTLVLALGALALMLYLHLGGITGEHALVPLLLVQVVVFPAAVGAAVGAVLGHLFPGR